MSVLPHDNRILVEVGDIGTASALGILLEDHPAEVGVEETLADGVGVLFGVGVAVVSAVVAGPPANGTFDSTSADKGEVDLERSAGFVGGVSPKTVVACSRLVCHSSVYCGCWTVGLTSSDAQTCVEVVHNGKDGGIEAEGNPVGRDEANHGNDDDEGGIEPVDVLVPVGPGHRGVGDVHLGGIMAVASAKRLVIGGAIGEGGRSLLLRGSRRRHVGSWTVGVKGSSWEQPVRVVREGCYRIKKAERGR